MRYARFKVQGSRFRFLDDVVWMFWRVLSAGGQAECNFELLNIDP
jgi:hypothetical protein